MVYVWPFPTIKVSWEMRKEWHRRKCGMTNPPVKLDNSAFPRKSGLLVCKFPVRRRIARSPTYFLDPSSCVLAMHGYSKRIEEIQKLGRICGPLVWRQKDARMRSRSLCRAWWGELLIFQIWQANRVFDRKGTVPGLQSSHADKKDTFKGDINFHRS